jgi:asparagine synthase (glutamine-hydrolysing)
MCGMCGILNLGEIPFDPDGRLLDRMTDSLAHRGPSDRGTWRGVGIGLGNRRLAVIDLSSAGHQPMVGEDDVIHVTYNGEVYNFRELSVRWRLRERGHTLHSGTDTEVILHGFEEFGPGIFAQLNGMFGLAIWDDRARTLYLARDRYGVKPVFYQHDVNHFRFGSEIKSILVDERVPRKASLQALHDFLSFDYVPGAQTAFEGILEVPPGHWLEVRNRSEISLHRYWDPSFEVDEQLSEHAAVRGARDLLGQAVQRQLVADVPVGVLLSGGLDSSALVALMTRHTREPVHTYAIGFDDASFDERPYANQVAQGYRTRHKEVVITSGMVRDMLPGYLKSIDEPYGDGSAIPTYYVSQLAAQDVVVVLSGEGGDEAFGGYETYAAFRAAQWFRLVPRPVRQGVIVPLVQQLPVSDKKLSLEFRLKRFLGGQDLSTPEAHLWWRIVLTEIEKRRLYTPSALESLQMEPSVRFFEKAFSQGPVGDPLASLMLVDQLVFLPDDLMIKNDRMTMAHSLEARVPFTDNDLMDFMARVPSRLKLHRMRKKHVLRRAMAGLLPPAILNKKKVGLEMPYSRWLKGDLRDLVDRYLGVERVRETGILRPEGIQTLVAEHLDGRRDNGRALWGLLNYMMWRELYGVT